MISRGNSNRLVQNLGISFHSRKRLLPSLELASTGLSILCPELDMPWRCSGGRCRSVLPAVASTGSPIASSRSPPRHANSAHPENGQRLAGYVGFLVSEPDRPSIRKNRRAAATKGSGRPRRSSPCPHLHRVCTVIYVSRKGGPSTPMDFLGARPVRKEERPSQSRETTGPGPL